MPTSLHDGYRRSGQHAVTCAISARKEKPFKEQFLLKISPYGCNHQRCQPAAEKAMKAMGYPTGMYTDGGWRTFH